MDYNPRSPQDIGMEWVPIQQADLVPDNFNEYGYVMRIDNSATLVSGGIGVNALPPQTGANIAEGINVYPFITAADTGPVRMVTIPVQSGAITGSNIVLINATNVADALSNPIDVNYVFFTAAGASDYLGLNFGVTAFTNALSGKRIVKVRLVYAAGGGEPSDLTGMDVFIARAASFNEQFTYQQGLEGAVSINTNPLALNTNFGYIDLGDWNPTWTPGSSSGSVDAIFPWRYTELANLDTATPINTRQQIVFNTDANIMYLGYVALQVLYCEETRVAYGGRRQISVAGSSATPFSFQTGENRVSMRSTALAASTVLPPGNYLVTATHRAVSNFAIGKLPPTYAAIRQLNEQPPPVVGKIVKPTIVIDDEFGVEETDVITDISLFTAVAAVTGSHAYSNQIGAPVYGTITATQDVHVRPEISVATSYAQIRFYARRFNDTQVPLKATVGASTASITVDDFDSLDEINDGWKEVTLTLSAAVSLTGDTTQTVVWSAPFESAGNQWQVLGASMYTTSPNINITSYDPPVGASSELTWKSPNVTSSTLDAQSDAMILLAQNLPAPTSFELITASQAISGIGEECGVPNGCVPTEIDYVNLTWDMPIICDDFNRVVASGFGTATSGDAWTVAAFTGTSLIDGERGIINHNAVNDYFTATVNVGVVNQRVYAEFGTSVVATGATITQKVVARYTDTSNYYSAIASLETSGELRLQVSKRVAGAHTIMATVSQVGAYGVNSNYAVELQVVGTWLYARLWNTDDSVPPSWQVVLQDTSLATGNLAGVRTRLESSNSNTLPVALYVDNFMAQDVRYVDSRLEIQRQDDLDGDDWQTIIDATNYCLTNFQDYEARVGEQSRYRARFCDSLDFCGPWVTGAATLAAPGVTVGGDASGLLIFTSNHQPGSNLAYTMAWDSRPIETYTFPEVDTQVFQRMYGRNFQVAFRPLERGGEVFERVILVQAAAIPIPSLANFVSLRDLAWADLPYVCVRDELGNRWYANVLVPSGTVQRGRRLYLAQIRVTEVAETSAPVV